MLLRSKRKSRRLSQITDKDLEENSRTNASLLERKSKRVTSSTSILMRMRMMKAPMKSLREVLGARDLPTEQQFQKAVVRRSKTLKNLRWRLML
jgi:hypothetical protein